MRLLLVLGAGLTLAACSAPRESSVTTDTISPASATSVQHPPMAGGDTVIKTPTSDTLAKKLKGDTLHDADSTARSARSP
jgi:hypothetical protein